MSRSKIVILVSVLALLVFVVAGYVWQQNQINSAQSVADTASLERPYSPSFGPANAKVTIVEFFDPACEACRAFYPFVKRIMAEYPQDVRLVLRYTTFHEGSDEVVRILEAARKQDLFKPVLEEILKRQPEWAIHGSPDISKAWAAAEFAGLDIAQAEKDANAITVTSLLKQEAADVRTMKVEKRQHFCEW
ncbi:thioredoxin domain-containing protein [Aliamphritea spongicola]|nr:thioredoxin domain-containing protein [Aliamphritea spongicola]